MDAKNRLTVPAKWLGDGENEFYALPDPKSHFLIVMPPEEFTQYEERIQASDAPAQAKRIAIRQFYSAAQLISADKQGRVLLGEDQCARVGLSGEAVLVGGRSRFEIWPKERWQQSMAADAEIFAEMAEKIGL